MQQVFLTSNSSSAQFQIGNVMSVLQSKMVKLDSFEWFNLYQNVPADMTLNFNQNPGPVAHSITINKGNYTADELAEALQKGMNTAIGANNFTVTYNTKTFKFDIVNIQSFSLVYSGSTLMPLLGFDADTVYATSVSSSNVCDLSPIDAIYVECNLVNDSWKEGSKRSILAKIQVDKGPGQMIFYKSGSVDDWINLNTESNTVNIRLLDHNLNQIPSWGVNWNMCLLFR